MNRKIKFRGNDYESNEWLYGNLIQRAGRFPNIMFDYEYNGKIYYAEHPVKQETVGQFTGLYDKNGKEIYEGDRLRLVGDDDDEYAFVVVWNNELGAWCIRFEFEEVAGIKPLGEWLCEYAMEVVGNIHDEPEEGGAG